MGKITPSIVLTSAAEGATTDLGERLQQERALGVSQGDPEALQRYDQYHQKIATLSQSAFKNRLRHPTVVEVPGSDILISPPGSTPPDGPRFWAVLIGIDGYELPLRGCVEDVYMMEDYSTHYLGVRPERIQRLLGKGPGDRSRSTSNLHPTRMNIIATLHRLSTNSEIKQGDSIIIFFSGHGSAYHCPECSRRIFDSHSPVRPPRSESEELHRHRCPIEALCPIDRGTLNIPDISDREMNNILREIYRATGAYITVILDCCHSVGATRAPSRDVRTVHSLGDAYFRRMLDSAKEDMGRSDNYQDVWSDQWVPDTDSHVVLAACQDYEYAKEWKSQRRYSRVFTEALLKALQSNSLGKEATYVDLINALPKISGQNPILAGKRILEPLWR
ncbi:uncharacterized protein ARMOST_21579 [Armillaria ostoyae]|uniref:Peptidase C14 caspase domain-containing protein n=1 Tax=Armillaria ostoyae TaxID=47428 RepID=A0A284SAG1_ARMOS|nr:uncharacterized protein ARMOST_21579 [Armillaria ostoyae]